MSHRALVAAFSFAVGAAVLGACHKTPETAPAPMQAAATTDDAAARRAAEAAAARAAQMRADSIARANAAANSADATRARAEVLTTLAQKVYFDYDQDVLRDDARAVLDAKAGVLAANPSITMVVTGHTDERGTAEYNLALGQRRAAQVKRYLVAKGLAENRFATQSMGDSQPAVQGTDESAYQQNRRAEFEAMNTSGALVRARQ